MLYPILDSQFIFFQSNINIITQTQIGKPSLLEEHLTY